MVVGVVGGLSNQEIADACGITASTVRNNIADMYDKLGLTNRVQALRWVMAHDDLTTAVIAGVEMVTAEGAPPFAD